jgi:hypothetical protein
MNKSVYKSAQEMRHPVDTGGSLMFDSTCPYCLTGRVHQYGKEAPIN